MTFPQVRAREFDPSSAPSQVGSAPQPYEGQTTLGYETITVTAGTFINCWKMESATQNSETLAWVHTSVPIFGLVKTETKTNGVLMVSMELIA